MSGVPEGLEVIRDRYKLVRQIAKGGMGVVYEGLDQKTGARCAVKILKGRAGGPHSSLVKRFKREAQLGERLGQHPGIVFIYDSGGLDSGDLFCVMEFVEGMSFDEKIAAGLSREEGVRLMVEVSRAVSYAHERDVIHRDLKPQNVLITPEGRARLTDFGVAKALDDIDGITATGAVMGTLGFMAPEQVTDSKRVDARSDVYGLGGMLYVALTGKEPLNLEHLSVRKALLVVLDTPIKPARQVDPTIDEGMNSICMRALAREPDLRHATAAAFADELEAWLGGDRTVKPLPPEYVPEEDPDLDEGGSGVAFLVIMALGVMILGGVIAYVLING